MSTLHFGQRQDILNLLRAAAERNEEVTCFTLCEHSLNYRARVSELRREGYTITNRTERVNGQVHGYYKLDLRSVIEVRKTALSNRAGSSDLARNSSPIAKPSTSQKTAESPSLFGDLAPLPKYPD
jgi:hypothetical protein